MTLAKRRESLVLCALVPLLAVGLLACGESGGEDTPEDVELSQEELNAAEIDAAAAFVVEVVYEVLHDLVNVPVVGPIGLNPDLGAQPLSDEELEALKMAFDAVTAGAQCQFSVENPEAGVLSFSFESCAYGELAVDGELTLTFDSERGDQSVSLAVDFGDFTVNGRTIDGTASGTVEASARDGELAVTLSTEGDLAVSSDAGSYTLSLELTSTVSDQTATTSGSGSAQLDGTTYTIEIEDLTRDFDGTGADGGSVTVTFTNDEDREVSVELRFSSETQGGAEVIVNGRSLGTLSFDEICQLITGASCALPSG